MRCRNARAPQEGVNPHRKRFRIACKRQPSGEMPGKPSLNISEKPVGIAAVSQVPITRGRQFWVVAAERDDARRFIVHADEMLTASLELQAAIHHQLELG